MSGRGARQTVFVCAGISDNNELITRVIAAESPKEATDLFCEQVSFQPKEVLGPFYKKKTQVIETTRVSQVLQSNQKSYLQRLVSRCFFVTRAGEPGIFGLYQKGR